MIDDMPEKPETPDDYEPLGKEFPFEKEDIEGGEPKHEEDNPGAYEHIHTDEKGRGPGMRRTGHFEMPDPENDDVSGEGWTVPTRPGGGWDKSLDMPLEEQLEDDEESEKKPSRKKPGSQGQD